MEHNIITQAERLHNLEIIEKCKKGLFFVYINRKYKTDQNVYGGSGYATLVFDGQEVDLEGVVGKSLTELNDEKWCLDIDNDGKNIPKAFLPTNLFENALFNKWKNT